MFTGLIQQVGVLMRIEQRGQRRELSVGHGSWTPPLSEGESIAVNGVCLTVVCRAKQEFTCHVLDETWRKTNLGAKRTGSRLNLERAVRAEDALGGHIVTGHVDGLGMVSDARQDGLDRVVRVKCAPDLMDQIVDNGSVACDGVSLTVSAVSATWFEVHLIPFTLSRTSLETLARGDKVNIETDVIGKYVRRYIAGRSGKRELTVDDLRKAGFA